MSVWLIYGKRNGFIENGKPIYDRTFRALDSRGIRVNRLENAMAYATKKDAEEILNKPAIQENIKKGLVVFEIRKG